MHSTMQVQGNDIYYFCSFPFEFWKREGKMLSVSRVTSQGSRLKGHVSRVMRDKNAWQQRGKKIFGVPRTRSLLTLY